MKQLAWFVACAFVAAIPLAVPRSASAATRTWNVTSGTWSDAANWLGGVPDASNDGYFANTATGTTTLSASGTSLGLTFANSAAMTFLPVTSTRTLTLGTGGITMNAGAANVTFGQNLTTRLDLALAGSQTWTNNSSSGSLTINNYVSPSVAGTTTLTLAGSGNFSFPNSSNLVIGDGSGVLALKLDSSGTTTIGGANTFTGGATVSAGWINLNSTGALGSNTVTVTGNATFSVAAASNISIANNFSVNAGASATFIGKGVAPNQFGFSGSISGAGAVILGSDINKQGLLLSGSSSFLGGASINTNTSTLAINNDYALSTGTVTIGNSSNFDSYRAGGVGLPNNPVVINSTFTYGGTQPINFGTGAVTLNATPTITTNGTAALTFGGVISGGFGITKAGTSTLVLGGANTFTGTTTLNAGTLQLTNQNSLQGSTLTLSGTGAVVLDSAVAGNAFTFGGLATSNAAASLALQNSAATAVAVTVGGNNASTTYAGGLTGPGSLIKTGTGTLTFSGTNTYAGTTRVNAGVLALSATSSLYGGTTANWTATNITTGSGATLALTVGSAGPRFTSANLDTLLGMTSTGSTGFLAGSTLGIDTTGTSFTYATNIANPNGGANALGLTKLGTGTLALSGSNSYTGPTTIAGGILQAGTTSALGNSASLTFTGGTLQVAAGANGLNFAGGVRNSTSAITIDPNSQGITLSGAIDSTNTAGLTISTGGTVTLSGNNSYSGTTALSTSTLAVVIGSNTAFGTSRVNVANNNNTNAISALTDVVLSNTVSWNTTAAIAGSNSIELAGSTYFGNPSSLSTQLTSSISSAGGKLLTLSGPVYLQASGSSGNASATLAGTGNTLISGTIRDSDTGSGTSSFTISNTGTTTLSGNNSYSGATTLSGAGVVIIGNNAAFGSGTVTASGAVTIQASTDVLSVVNAFALTNNPTFRGSNSIGISGGLTNSGNSRTITNNLDTGKTLSFSGTTFLQESGTGVGRTLTLAGTGNTTFSGAIVNGGTAGTSSLTISNSGTTTLSGSSGYSGVTTLSGAGTVILGDNAAFGTSGVTTSSAVKIQSSADLTNVANAFTLTANPTFQGSNTIGISGNITNSGGSRTITNNLDTGKTLSFSGTTFLQESGTGVGRTFTVNGSGNTTFSGPIVNGGTAGSSGFTHGGSGVIVFSGTNVYTGTTTVNGGGVLRLDNASALPGGIALAGGSSALVVSNGIIGLGAGNFTRGLGTGAAQVNLTGTSGFAAYGDTRVVNIGNASGTMTWAGTNFTSGPLLLSAADATGTLDFQNPIALGTAGTTRTVQVADGSATVDAKLSGILSGSANLQKTGAGTLQLTAANTYTGTTTIAVGVLQIGDGNATGSLSGSSVITGSTGATLAFSRNDNYGGNVTNTIGGAIAVSQLGSGTLTLSGSNTFSGGVGVTLGQLAAGSSNALGTGTSTISGGVLNIGSYSPSVAGFNITSGSLIGTGTLTATNGYALQGGAVNAVLGANAITVSAGTTTLGSAGRFNSGSGLTISGGQLMLGGTETVASYLQSGGILGGSGKTLTATTYALQGGSVNANLGTGTVNVTVGTTTLSGTASASAINVTSGSFVLGGSGLLSSNATVTVNGGVLDTTSSNFTAGVSAFNMSSGLLNGGGTITASAYGLQGGTINAVLGAGAITVSTGTTALGSAGRFNSNSGLTISSGQLTLGGSESVASFVLSGGVLGGSGKTLTSTADYDLRSGSVLANLGGSAALVKSTSGTVTLSGANTHSGGTQIANGVLQLGSNTALPTSSAVTLGTDSTAGVLAFNGNTATLGAITFNGSGSQLSGTSLGGKLNLLASGTANATITVNSGSHALHPDTTLQSNTVINLAPGSYFSLHGVIDGSNSLTQIGSGTLAIYGANSYSGGTYLSGGYLSVQNTGALGDGTVTIDGNSILNLNNTILTNTVVFGSGSGAIINSGTLVNVSGTYAITSGTGSSITTNYSVQPGGNISFVNNLASTVYVQGTAQGTFSSEVATAGTVIVNAGGRGVFSGGVSGNVTTSGTSLFSSDVLGNVTVAGGTATFTAATGAASAINVNSGLGVVTGTIGSIAHATAAGATLEIRGRVLSTADVNAEAGGIVKLMGSQAFDGTTIENDGSVIVDRTANLVLGAVISGSGSLTKSDNLTLTLTGNNTFSGMTTISGGTLSVGGGGTSGAIAGDVVNNAGLVFNRSDATTYGGLISGSGLVRLLSGSLTLSGSNSYSGGTWIDGGTLTAGDVKAFGSGEITLGSGATLDLANLLVTNAITNNGGTILGGSISGTVTASSNTTINSGLGAGAVVTVANGVTATFGDDATVAAGATITTAGGTVRISRTTNTVMQFAGTITGSGGLTVDGGRVKLSGANTYTGLTQVSGSGTLLAVNSQVQGNVQVGANAELGGSGLIKGTVGGDGLIGPGNSPGILTVSQVDPTPLTSFAFEFTKTGDPIWSSGTASQNDVLHITGPTPFVTSLTGSNVVNIYFEVSSLSNGDIFRGGFFSDASNLNIGSPTYQYFVLNSGSGSILYNGTYYDTLSTYLASHPGSGITGVTQSVVTSGPANFSTGTVYTGQVTQFVIIPEPDTIIFAGIGIAMAGWSLWKRRRIAEILRK